MIQNMTWSGVYLGSTFSYAIIQKVLKLVPLTATGPDVYVATMNTVLSYSYASSVETLNHMKSIKLKDHMGENVADCCGAILVDTECLWSAGGFKLKHLVYIIRVFEDTSDSIFRIWETQKYKEVMQLIKKICVCGEYVMRPDDIITYGSLVQESMR